MDSQLVLLQEIKSAMWILIYIVGANLLVQIFRAVAAAYKTIKSELSNTFYNAASSMFESGQYANLIEYCHQHIRNKSNEAYAY